MLAMEMLQTVKPRRAFFSTQVLSIALIALIMFTTGPATKASDCRPETTLPLFSGGVLDAAYARFDDGGNFFVSFLLDPRNAITAFNGCADSDGLIFDGGLNTIAPASGTRLGTMFSPLQGTVTAGGLGSFQPLFTINFQEDFNRTNTYNPKTIHISVTLDLNNYYDLVNGTLKTKPAYRNQVVNIASFTAVR
jgi:hypothetical protein